MKKLILHIFVIIFAVSVFAFSVSAATCSLTDKEASEALHELGLLQGVGTNADGSVNFNLKWKLTREQAVTMIVRLLGAESEALNANNPNPFTDVAAWAVPYVSYAYANGITKGISATEFDGDGVMKDYEFITMILRTLGYSDANGDFTWNAPYTLAKEVGISESSASNSRFNRGNSFIFCYNALTANTKSGESIVEQLVKKGVFTTEKFEEVKIDRAKLTEGADLRIMSFNILAELWDAKAAETMPVREKLVPAILQTYKPDVVGVQEVSGSWYYALKTKLADEYAFVSYFTPDGKHNYTNILYNVNKAELIEYDTTLYTVKTMDTSHRFTWARFKRLSDGAEYIVTCTHWHVELDYRKQQWNENAKMIKELYEKYKLPIFATGDYNSTEKSFFTDFINAASMLDPITESEAVNNAGTTYHDLSVAPKGSDMTLDHIAVAKGPELLYYNRITCPTALEASDHCPIFIDVKLP